LKKTESMPPTHQSLSAVASVRQALSNNHRFSTLALLGLLSLGSLASFDAHALALGRLNVLSSIGEPLRAEIDIIDLTAAAAESFQSSIASADAYKAKGLDYNPDLSSMQFTLQRSPDGSAVLLLSNSRPVNSGFVDLVLEVSWASGKIIRDFTLLLTPPKEGNAATPMATVLPITSVPAVAAPTPTSTENRSRPTRSASAAPAKRVTVVRGDTAGQLALQSLPLNVSLDQMLLALLRSNPDAFVAGNVNRLKAGAVLAMPSAADATTVPRDEARQTIVAQSRDFNAFRQQLASNARQAQVSPSGREATGKVQSKVEEKTAAAAAADKLTLSKGALKSGVSDAGNTEEKLSQERQAKDAADRLAELSKNISDLNKLGVAPTNPVAIEEAQPAGPSLAVGAPSAGAVAALADKEQTGLIDRLSNDPTVLPATAGFLGLLLAWGFFRLRRNSADKNGGFRSAVQGVDTASKASAELIEPSLHSDGSKTDKPGPLSATTAFIQPTKLSIPAARQEPLQDNPPTTAQGDEALGLDTETQRLIALNCTPELMDTYIDLDDVASFENLAIEALTVTGGRGKNWELICIKGRALDPTNPLYQLATTSPTATPPFNKLDFDLELNTKATDKAPPRAKS
jgi:pilus assembly protein FimV